MKNEAEFNTIVTKSLDWGFKIPDTGNSVMYAPKNRLPFDGFGAVNGKPVYFESKYLSTVRAFNFNRLEDHQIENLLKLKELMPDALVLFLICVDFGRGDKRVFFFRDMDYVNQRKMAKDSITKKEFLARRNYVKIKKGLMDFNELMECPLDREHEKDLVRSLI